MSLSKGSHSKEVSLIVFQQEHRSLHCHVLANILLSSLVGSCDGLAGVSSVPLGRVCHCQYV